MMVERNTFIVKPHRDQEAIRMLQDWWKWPGRTMITHRTYRTISGLYNAVYQELEFEDFEARDKWWADVMSRPEQAQWLEKWLALAGGSSSREFLTLME